MTDYALIALSSAFGSKKGYDEHERNKALLLYQYLKKLGYNIKFLVPKGMSVPFSNEIYTRDNLLAAMDEITTDDTPGNVICYISDSPKEVSRRIPIFLKDMINLLQGRIQDPNRMKKILITFLNRTSKEGGLKLSCKQVCKDMISNFSSQDSIYLDIEKLIGVLGKISREGYTELPEWSFLIDLYQDKETTAKGKVQPPNEKLHQILKKRGDLDILGLQISMDAIGYICEMIMEMDDIIHINIYGLISSLRHIHIHNLMRGKTAYIQLSEKLDLDLNGVIFLSQIEEKLQDIKNKTIMIFGSGNNSRIIAEQLSGEDRLIITSMMSHQSPAIDQFNIGNGLVRASYSDLKKYTPGKDVDPIKAFSLEMVRLAKIGALKDQYPLAWFDYDFLENNDLLPFIPDHPDEPLITLFDPQIGAFVAIIPGGVNTNITIDPTTVDTTSSNINE